MDVQAAVDLRINTFTEAAISELESGITNGMVEREGDKIYVQQRPSIDLLQDASDTISIKTGRGLFHWEQTGATYFLVGGTLYKNNYGGVLSSGLTDGDLKCTFVETETHVVIFDFENDEAWTINGAETVAAISDLDFPANIVSGGAYLDGYVFVMDEAGAIWNCDLDAPTAWTATSFVTCERAPDKGVYCAKQLDHIVGMSSTSLEFFFNDSNSSGSPLTRRQDIYHSLGCASGPSVAIAADDMFFIGRDTAGALAVYQMSRFSPKKISNATIDSFITESIVKEAAYVVGACATAQGHTMYFLTFYYVPDGDPVPTQTIVYDTVTQLWYIWKTTLAGNTHFPLVDWDNRNAAQTETGRGLFVNGDVITFTDNMVPVETSTGALYVAAGYVAGGYVQTFSNTEAPLTLKVRSGLMDHDDDFWKFNSSIKPVHNKTNTSYNATIRWSNEKSSGFNSGRTIDTSLDSKVWRCGRFRQRNYEFEYSGEEQLRFRKFKVNYRTGAN